MDDQKVTPQQGNGALSSSFSMDEPRKMEMGINPYFPETEDQGAQSTPQETAPEQGEKLPAGEPTFDSEADARNGIDVNSESYKHFQAAFTRARQRDKGELEKRLEKVETTQQLKESENQESESDSEYIEAVNWEGFAHPVLNDEAQLHGTEAEIGAIVQRYIDHALQDVKQQSMAFAERQAQNHTQMYLTRFMDEVAVAAPDKQQEVLALMAEYSDIARTKPEAFVKFAVNSLDLAPEPVAAPAAPAAYVNDSRKQVNRIRANSSARPTSPDTSLPAQKVYTGPNATRDAVEDALRAQLERE